MRRPGRGIPVWLSLLVLLGCGRVVATATPDPATAAGYREVLAAHGQRMADAVVATNTACFARPLAGCAQAVTEQGMLFAAEVERVRATPPPPGCAALANSYLAVASAGERFFALTGEAAASGDARRVTAALGEGYPPFIRALDGANGALVGEGCREG